MNVFIYPKPDFVPATYTILNFQVTDIDADVSALIAAGVVMQRYPGLEADDMGIVRDPRGPMIAWFTDPAGNIISVLQDVRSYETYGQQLSQGAPRGSRERSGEPPRPACSHAGRSRPDFSRGARRSRAGSLRCP